LRFFQIRELFLFLGLNSNELLKKDVFCFLGNHQLFFYDDMDESVVGSHFFDLAIASECIL
jgi:hypothetical protein